MSIEEQQRPLVTFVVLAYNQEKYVQYAVEGALAQTYSPLEIIISDDASSDRTFSIMQECAGRYHGPHRVHIKRNERNLGIGAHCRKLFALATGDYVVLAAGDDVSDPLRVECVVAEFTRADDVKAVVSNVSVMDEDDKCIEPLRDVIPSGKRMHLIDFLRNGGGLGTGAAYAYKREVLMWPYEYPSNLINEDRLLPFRARILGRVVQVERALVKYRLSFAGVSRSIPAPMLLAVNKPEHIKELRRTVAVAVAEGRIARGDIGEIRTVLALLALRARFVRWQAMRGNRLVGGLAGVAIRGMNVLLRRTGAMRSIYWLFP